MSHLIGDKIYSEVPSSYSRPGLGPSCISVDRQTGDPYYWADVILQNPVIGSRYLLTEDADPLNELSTGVITTDPQVLSDIPASTVPFLMKLRLRNASGSPYYKTFETRAYHSRLGVIIYILQELDQ